MFTPSFQNTLLELWKPRNNFPVNKESKVAGAGNIWYFPDIPGFPASMENTHKSRDFANPEKKNNNTV